MPQESLEKRVEKLEDAMTGFAGLPPQVAELASRVSQLGGEMRVGFSAIRDEIRAGDEETRRQLREEIRIGDEETRTQMRILHEDVIERIALLQENLGDSTRRREKPPRGRPGRKTR